MSAHETSHHGVAYGRDAGRAGRVWSGCNLEQRPDDERSDTYQPSDGTFVDVEALFVLEHDSLDDGSSDDDCGSHDRRRQFRGLPGSRVAGCREHRQSDLAP